MKVGLSDDVLDMVEDKSVDVGLIESPIFRDGFIYREWAEDELVLFSNRPIPRSLKPEDLFGFDWLCRDEQSHTRKLAAEVFEEIGVDCSNFNIIGVVGTPTAVKESVMYSSKDAERPVVSVISRNVIQNELASGQLFEARIRNHKIHRKLYIVYSKDRKHDAFVDNVVDFLLALKV
jgi:DNA-binding transcriptional LysR family regulator